MDVLGEKVEQGVVEQRFDLRVDGDTVPGIRWNPEGATGPRPTILIGHGGTQHKRVPNVLGLARRFVRHLGYSAVALDAPGHGDRITDPELAERRRRAIEARLAAGPDAERVDLGPERRLLVGTFSAGMQQRERVGAGAKRGHAMPALSLEIGRAGEAGKKGGAGCGHGRVLVGAP